MKTKAALAILLSAASPALAQSNFPPWDLWSPQVVSAIRDRSTLELSHTPRGLYADVFFTSNASANWFEARPPYAEHRDERIRIHAYLVTPSLGGPFPAVVIGHGHGGQADLTTAQFVATAGYVAFYIDGPQAGQSTGGPSDDNQAWISVDKGPEYGYLYHYAYAGMRALTALEKLAELPGNPYRIDPNRLGVLGASMGGILTTYVNAVDDRVKAAIIMASAGSWPHTLRYPNSWLYDGIYAGTRDIPYNGNDPVNSIEDIDADSTAITFLNYFDPLRYANGQHAPVLTLIGTHDQYFPLPNANLMLQAITSAGTSAKFEKRLWLLPNAPHAFAESAFDLLSLVPGLQGWLDYAFGSRAKPLATPQVSMTAASDGLRFEIGLAESSARLAGARAVIYAATRVDSTVSPIRDFTSYTATLSGDRFSALIPAGAKTPSGDTYTADNVIYYATVTDSGNLPVSSLVYKGLLPMDLSTAFVPAIDKRSTASVPLPPPLRDAAVSISSSRPTPAGQAYQGLALANPGNSPLAVRVEARSDAGRIAASEGLLNPIYMFVPPLSQRVFLAHEWFGPGALNFDGSFHAAWSDARSASLSFRGDLTPAQLEGIGPLVAGATELWLPLAPEQDPAAVRRIRIFGIGAGADVQLQFWNRFGAPLSLVQVHVEAAGTVDVTPAGTGGSPNLEPASVRLSATAPISARLEVGSARDTWSLEARPIPSAVRYVQPHTEWNGTFTTTLLFVNPSDSQRQVIRRLRTPQGVEVGPTTFFFMQPHATASITVENLFPVGTLQGAGWIDIESPGGPIVVAALAVDPGRGAAAASAVEAAGSGAWSMPFYVENAGYWTGLAVANPGDGAVQLQIRAYDRAGSLLGSVTPPTLEARQSLTELVYQWIPNLPRGTTGHIVISSTGPVQLLAYFGTDDGAAMAAVPFQPIAP